jgi:hypothetical protein
VQKFFDTEDDGQFVKVVKMPGQSFHLRLRMLAKRRCNLDLMAFDGDLHGNLLPGWAEWSGPD